MDSKTSYNRRRPLVGVFINPQKLHRGVMKQFAVKLHQANKKTRCSIFFFTPENIDWTGRRIGAYVWQGRGRGWLPCSRPFPDIIYDRGTGFAGGENAAVEALRARFQKQAGIRFINSGKLKKWQVHRRLSRHKAVREYLPDTVWSRGLSDIREALERHGYLFLKSSGGSGGRNVLALERSGRGFCCHYHQGRHRKRYLRDLSGLPSELRRIGLTPGRVVIQQGIRLVKYRGRLLDLRVLMVKGRQGLWEAVYNQARVAKKGAAITNVSLGGEVMNYSDLYPALQKQYPGMPPDASIRDLCGTIARCIEKEFGPFGEIGIDMGVDETGRLWLLEANSKPSKLPEKEIEDTVGISPQFLMTLEYARLLYKKVRGAFRKSETGRSG